ncbi:MAG: 3-isopropylmalate dehydratase small subunit [Candidatus Altiarchaeales archaeon]|nr:3-isopropylmalate dehydratase small subunit [Candidatus Altiarchaeales archaeon]
MREEIVGRAWVFEDNVDTDQIIPAEYLVTADPRELGEHAFEKVRPDFTEKVGEGDVIVAGENFGCGSSREHAPLALLGCGVSCVIAESFARIFYRNSINLGFPVIECSVEAEDGDEIKVDFTEGVVVNKTQNKSHPFKPLPDFLKNLIESGGLIEYTKEKLK